MSAPDNVNGPTRQKRKSKHGGSKRSQLTFFMEELFNYFLTTRIEEQTFRKVQYKTVSQSDLWSNLALNPYFTCLIK